MPRKAKEAIGAIARLTATDGSGRAMTVRPRMRTGVSLQQFLCAVRRDARLNADGMSIFAPAGRPAGRLLRLCTCCTVCCQEERVDSVTLMLLCR